MASESAFCEICESANDYAQINCRVCGQPLTQRHAITDKSPNLQEHDQKDVGESNAEDEMQATGSGQQSNKDETSSPNRMSQQQSSDSCLKKAGRRKFLIGGLALGTAVLGLCGGGVWLFMKNASNSVCACGVRDFDHEPEPPTKLADYVLHKFPTSSMETKYYWSADGTSIYSVDQLDDHVHVHIFDVRSGEKIWSKEYHAEDLISDSELSPDKTRIAFRMLRGDQSLRIIDLKSGEHLFKYTSSDNLSFQQFAWSPDGNRLSAASAWSGVVWVWDTTNGQSLIETHPDPAPLHVASNPVSGDFGWSPEGQRIATTFKGSRAIQVWDTTNGHLLATHPNTSVFLWSPDGKYIASGPSGEIHANSLPISWNIWDVWTGKTIFSKDFKLREPCYFHASWVPNHTAITFCIFGIGTDKNSVEVWNVEQGQRLSSFQFQEENKRLGYGTNSEFTANYIESSWSPDGKKIAMRKNITLGNAEQVEIRDAGNGKLLHTYRGWADGINIRTSNQIWSPDGQKIALTYSHIYPNMVGSWKSMANALLIVQANA